MLIVLIGYRGTGKSTVARLVAERVGWPAFDADVEVERRAGKTIRQLFVEDGEARFRDLEAQTVADLMQQTNAVVALGGGAVLREDNRRAMAEATVIWLKAAAPTIQHRLATDPKTAEQRPNLTRQGGLAEIEFLLQQREPAYRACADWVVETDGKAAEQVAEEIVCLLQREAAS